MTLIFARLFSRDSADDSADDNAWCCIGGDSVSHNDLLLGVFG
jgi:hypothetical protein